MPANVLALCILAVLPDILFAQQQATEEQRRVTVEEIVVTAQKRAESVQDVPIAMTAFSSKEIANAGVTDFTGLKRLAPDVQITNDTVLTRVTLRGVGTNSNDETQDQSIGINIDGEYLNRPTALNASLFDLERIEVLRGPQGTLYGRTATGGAISFITRKPGDELTGNASLTYGDYDQVIAEAGLTVPVSDILSFRIAGMYAENEGFSYHPGLNDRSGDQGVTSGRLGMLLTPTDQLEIYLAAELVDVSQTSPGQAWVNLNAPGSRADEPVPGTCSSPGWVEVAPLVEGVQCIPQGTSYLSMIDRDDYDAPITGIGFEDNESTVFRGRVNYDFGPMTFTYLGGYRESKLQADVALSPAFTFKNFQIDIETQSHEFRLNGETDNGIIWQGGAFLFYEKQEVVRGLFSPFIGPNGSYITFFSRPFVDTDSWAVFGQADFPISDRFTLVVGGRYTDDERSAQFDNYGFVFNSGPINVVESGATPILTIFPEAQADEFTWLLGLNYTPTDETLIYAKASTGFKPGGFDSVGAYDPETVEAFEVGTKNTFDGRYTVNGSAFFYDYTDLQVGVLLDSTVGNQVFNAAAATIWGVEGQFEALVTDNDRLTFTVNYLNGEYDDFPASLPVQCLGGCPLNGVGDLDPGTPGVQQPSLSGNTPPRTPEWIATLGWEHIFDLPNGAALTFDARSRYNDGYFTTPFNWNDDRQKSFTQTDVSLEYVPADAWWSVQLFARNLEDKRELTYAAFTSAGPDDIYNWQFGAPRTYGVRLAVDF